MNRHGDPLPISTMRHSAPVLGVPLAAHASQPPGPHHHGHHETDLKGYFNILYDSRWLIGAVTLAVTLLAIIYALVTSPVYEANLMIHVEEESPNASKNILSEVSSLFETKKAAIAEMELLRSRMVISNAVDNLQLYVDVRPKYFPLIGFWFANRRGADLSEPGLFGYGGYVWGGEKAEVSLFEVPAAAQNVDFTLVARGGGVIAVQIGEPAGRL
jgi:tyrosine-protein kinase Etk/Wzc